MGFLVVIFLVEQIEHIHTYTDNTVLAIEENINGLKLRGQQFILECFKRTILTCVHVLEALPIPYCKLRRLSTYTVQANEAYFSEIPSRESWSTLFTCTYICYNRTNGTYAYVLNAHPNTLLRDEMSIYIYGPSTRNIL